jgi:excinuclease UvrABC ATPase subunit
MFLLKNFSMFVRNFLPKYSQPDADVIEDLSMFIVVDQKRMSSGSHSTVGTATDEQTEEHLQIVEDVKNIILGLCIDSQII